LIHDVTSVGCVGDRPPDDVDEVAVVDVAVVDVELDVVVGLVVVELDVLGGGAGV
jgi:hypothetical protein